MIVAIDGPAGVGKSTVSKRIAESANLFYLNSGNFYRSITLAVIESDGDPESEEQVLAQAKRSRIELIGDRMHLDGRDVDDLLHTSAIDAWVAQHSAIVAVRHVVNDLLRKTAETRDLIAEGRDMTTVVFPHADVKVYLDANVTIRATRRLAQGVSTGTLEDVKANLEMRDNIDTNKEEGSLIIAPDAFYLDTSALTIEAVCERVLRKIRKVRSLEK